MLFYALIITLKGATLSVNATELRSYKVGENVTFKVTAKSKDGVVEAIEKIDNPKVWGVQFHPEILVSGGNNDFIGIFKALLAD